MSVSSLAHRELGGKNSFQKKENPSVAHVHEQLHAAAGHLVVVVQMVQQMVDAHGARAPLARLVHMAVDVQIAHVGLGLAGQQRHALLQHALARVDQTVVGHVRASQGPLLP